MSETPTIRDPVLDRFVNIILEVILKPNGELFVPLPWRDASNQLTVVNDTDEFFVFVHIKPGGLTASARVQASNSKAMSVHGPVDLRALAAKLV
jgi:hypothetical protein